MLEKVSSKMSVQNQLSMGSMFCQFSRVWCFIITYLFYIPCSMCTRDFFSRRHPLCLSNQTVSIQGMFNHVPSLVRKRFWCEAEVKINSHWVDTGIASIILWISFNVATLSSNSKHLQITWKCFSSCTF